MVPPFKNIKDKLETGEAAKPFETLRKDAV